MRKPLQVMKIREYQIHHSAPLTNTYGYVRHDKHGKIRPHQGWDLQAAPGTPVFAIATGTAKAGYSKDYGNWISIKFEHRGRTLYAFYAHLLNYSYKLVVQNQAVPEGTVIGFTGMSGNAKDIPLREAHLHFEIRTKEVPTSPSLLGPGLHGRIDPGEVLGYEIYSSSV
jgi:murein DD-endopeptidase MepM/ murein hydrolase activator NlpD